VTRLKAVQLYTDNAAYNNSPFTSQIALLSDYDTRNLFKSSEIEDLSVNRLDHLEGLAGIYGIHQEISVNSDGVFGGEDGVLVLPRR